MKNTIPNNSINNRKIIFEVRFDPNPYIVDLRGKILKEFLNTNIVVKPIWQIGDGMISISDSEDQSKISKVYYIDTQRFSYTSLSDSNESFFHNYEKLMAIVLSHLDLDIVRIGCRIQGTYSSTTTDYKTILNEFLKLFPANFLLDDFPAQDLHFQLTYQNGMYNIGPINVNDNWIKQNFLNKDLKREQVGFAIDTDNYIVKEEGKPVNFKQSKDVYMASLSVEKLLFEKLKDI